MTATIEQPDKERGDLLVKILKSGLIRTLSLSNNDLKIVSIVEQVLSESLCPAYNAGYRRGFNDGTTYPTILCKHGEHCKICEEDNDYAKGNVIK